MSHPRLKLLNSYYEIVNFSGREAYDHMINIFVLGNDAENESYLNEIPHPYREYVAKGQRMILEHMRKAAEMAEEPEAEPEVKVNPLEIPLTGEEAHE